MKLEDSHGGYHGKSLQEQIRDDLDQAYKEYVEFKDDPHWDEVDEGVKCGMAEGIAHALGILRSTSADVEWDAAKERYENPVPVASVDESMQPPNVCCPDHKRPIRVLEINETPDVDVFDPDDDFADNEFDEEFL